MKRPKLRTSFYADFCPILNVRRCIILSGKISISDKRLYILLKYLKNRVYRKLVCLL